MNIRINSNIRNKCKTLENIKSIFKFFKHNDKLSKKLLNRTRFIMIKTIYYTLIEKIQDIIAKEFDEYISLSNINISKTTALVYLGIYENYKTNNIILYEYLYNRFIEIIELNNLYIDNDIGTYFIITYMKIDKNFELVSIFRELV